ncbi:Gfo/Idh/MocA family protein [Armatimonas rosea]|uniref:Putative dehydrogenase n=1 Tax=Armatimonas rosea TaxID=685828 RepID=A0A7W9SSD2_ARMRO|nr:Gfo/Idh/MocA family oxidoreductase [Armatimonas rosea]MBB6051294.1 putative dehydrogenase [Armatimonas rosea]
MEAVRFGVLGCARVFERRMAPALKRAGNAVLHAVASRSPEKATATAQRHGAAKAYGSYEALLADSEIEAVYIPLPNDQHAEWTVKALAAGKHVLCDKPLALSVAEAEWMAGAASASGLRLMEGFMYRHHPQHQKVFEVLRSGAIGEPVHFRGVFTYPATADHAGIRWNPAQGGGAFLDVGVYPLNAARWLFGNEPTEAKALAVRDTATGVDIHTAALLAFPGGRTASLVAGFDQAFTSRYELIGREGSIVAERAFQVGESGVRVIVKANNSDTEEVFFFEHVDQFQLEVEHFAACVRDPQLSLEPGEDGVLQARAQELVRSAAQ